MLKFFTKSFFQSAAVIGMAVVLLLVVFRAVGSGRLEAQSQTILQSAKALEFGFEKFYSDQDRYPTASEFSDETVMRNYLIPFPTPQFTTPQCASSFVYKRPSTDRYQLFFCLPKATGEYKQGWNTVDRVYKSAVR